MPDHMDETNVVELQLLYVWIVQIIKVAKY